MVVCKCHKATKLYCFVHKVPVCGDCICQHPVCVVRTYSEWVLDGEYNWPSKCDACQEVLGDENPTTRLGCLHNFHSTCLEAHLKSLPAAAGYGCPSCGVPVWPPQKFRDVNSELPSKLKAVISQAGLADALIGDDGNSERPPTPPAVPAFSSLPLGAAGVPALAGQNTLSITIPNGTSEITAEESPQPSTSQLSKISPLPNSIARKSSHRPDKMIPLLHELNDEDAARRKYARRGPAYKQILRYIVPFWSPQLPTLPISAPRSEDDFIQEGPGRRRHQRAVDPRNILFLFAIFSCVATMMLLYYRLSQSSSMNSTS